MDVEQARARLIQQLSGQIRDERVLRVMACIPREFFVPRESEHLAYEDIPLPIGFGQTISQPFIVALMTEALELRGTERVLEIGTGSGYQAAILCELTRWVVTVERFPGLVEAARELLTIKLAYRNIEVHVCGKTLGWPEGAPYDGIIVTAGAPRVPQELLDQLRYGGRLVIPVGSRFEQELLKVAKQPGRLVTTNLGACRFVPLIGEGAWKEEWGV